MILPEEMDLETAKREADEHDHGDFGPRTQIVHLQVEIVAEA